MVKQMKRIKLDHEIEIEIIKKGERASKPLGFISWSNEEAVESGINVIWSNRGEFGAFISEKVLKRVLKEIDHDKKSTDENSDNDNDYPVYTDQQSNR